MAIFSFYVTANTFLQILLEISIPFFVESGLLKDNNNVSVDDINSGMYGYVVINVFKELVNNIQNDETLSPEEKQKQIEELAESVKKDIKNTSENKDKIKNKKNKKIESQ